MAFRSAAGYHLTAPCRKADMTFLSRLGTMWYDKSWSLTSVTQPCLQNGQLLTLILIISLTHRSTA